jgi:nicotinate-nucleotide--dimethylbenzimidazole phosphoribosyltransferase
MGRRVTSIDPRVRRPAIAAVFEEKVNPQAVIAWGFFFERRPTMTQQPHDLESMVSRISPIDPDWIDKARQRTAQLVMPTRALGRLHDMAERICAIQKSMQPRVDRKAILVMAADHGIVSEGVSAYPQAVTGEMIKTFLSGGAGINVLSRLVGADIQVVDMGIATELDSASIGHTDRLHIAKIAKGSANFAQGAAMTAVQARSAMMTGFHLASEMFTDGVQLLGTGDMGIGNTTPSAAIGAVVTGCALADMVGRGTGIDDDGLDRKKAAITKGISVNQPDPHNGVDVLHKVGGFEIGAIAGVVLAGAFHQRPVVIDGFISTAGALIAQCICPLVTDYLFAGHCSQEPGHKLMLRHLGLEPILDLGMRLGEGTGGALAMGILEGAVHIFTDMLTFEQAGVSDKPASDDR